MLLALLLSLTVFAPARVARADDDNSPDLKPTDDPLDQKDTKPISPRATHMTSNGVITQDLNYTELRMVDLANAQGKDEISKQVGDRCVEYFREWYGNGQSNPASDKLTSKKVEDAGDDAWNKCKSRALGEYADRIGADRTNFLLNKGTASSMLAPHEKSMGIPTSANESKLKPILPPLLTFGQVSHIYETQVKQVDMPAAEQKAREYNQNYQKYGIAYEGYVTTKEVLDDPENPNAGKHLQVLTDKEGKPLIDEAAYRKDVDAAVAKANKEAAEEIASEATPKSDPGNKDTTPKKTSGEKLAAKAKEILNRLHPGSDQKEADITARLNWLARHNPPKGAGQSNSDGRIKTAYTYKDLDGAVHDTTETHRRTFNRSRMALLKASNDALAKDVGHRGGGFRNSATGRTQTRPRREAADIALANRNRNPAAANPNTKDMTDEERDAELVKDRKVTLPEGAQEQIGQFSIGYKDEDLKKMLDDSVQNVLSTP